VKGSGGSGKWRWKQNGGNIAEGESAGLRKCDLRRVLQAPQGQWIKGFHDSVPTETDSR
jgi:hypothetical protein